MTKVKQYLSLPDTDPKLKAIIEMHMAIIKYYADAPLSRRILDNGERAKDAKRATAKIIGGTE